MIPPTEARATMAAYREGRTLEQFISDMWERRAAEHPPLPRVKRRRMVFPLQARADNVKAFRKLAKP